MEPSLAILCQGYPPVQPTVVVPLLTYMQIRMLILVVDYTDTLTGYL